MTQPGVGSHTADLQLTKANKYDGQGLELGCRVEKEAPDRQEVRAAQKQ